MNVVDLYQFRWWHVYAFGVVLWGVAKIIDTRLKSGATLPDGRAIDTRHLTIGVMSIFWPIVLLLDAVFWIGGERIHRFIARWCKKRGLYYENVKMSDGLYHCTVRPLTNEDFDSFNPHYADAESENHSDSHDERAPKGAQN